MKMRFAPNVFAYSSKIISQAYSIEFKSPTVVAVIDHLAGHRK